MTFYLKATDRDKAEHITRKFTEADAKGISTKWFEHLEDKDKKAEFAAVLRNNPQILDILKSILVKEYELCLTLKKSDYSNTNWAYLRADSDGYQRAIQNFLNLLTITK